MRRALGEDGDGTPARQHRACRVERLAVLRRVGPGILTPVHGNRLERATEKPDDGHAEEWRLREKRDAPWRQAQHEGGINEPAGVIEHEDHGAARRHLFEAGDFDAAKEDAQHQAEQRPEERSHGEGSTPALRAPRQAA